MLPHRFPLVCLIGLSISDAMYRVRDGKLEKMEICFSEENPIPNLDRSFTSEYVWIGVFTFFTLFASCLKAIGYEFRVILNTHPDLSGSCLDSSIGLQISSSINGGRSLGFLLEPPTGLQLG